MHLPTKIIKYMRTHLLLYLLSHYYNLFSECAGTSLFENLHVTRTRLALPMKINIAYQVAQAMAYLHAKKIVYKQMDSRNVFLEGNKAILSMIDFSTVYKSNS